MIEDLVTDSFSGASGKIHVVWDLSIGGDEG
jgi:hypothetical protein